VGLCGIYGVVRMGVSSVKKAYYYLKKNGIMNTYYASLERLTTAGDYRFRPVKLSEYEAQKAGKWKRKTTFSIVVPTYETKEVFLRDLIDSCVRQSYPHWELVIADASETDAVKRVTDTYEDDRIKYLKLAQNAGISANTNAGIMAATGEYIGLLDHDDVITLDALYEFAKKVEEGLAEGTEYAFIYSDEDKCDTNRTKYYEPNIKPDFNLDLLLTNNYICHFLMVRGPLLKKLKLRSQYDGAQDHDLVLRAYATTHGKSSVRRIGYGHIPRVLYHWRCHEGSTASNPQSKLYAYKAGAAAIADYLGNAGIHAEVKPLKHNGFFRVVYKDYLTYPEDSPQLKRKKELTADARGSIAYRMYLNRYDVGAIGGPVIYRKKITAGIIDEKKSCPYDGMNMHFSGYMHRAVLQQRSTAVDIRNMLLNEEVGRCLIDLAEDEKYGHLFNQELINELKEQLINKNLNSPYIDVTALLTDEVNADFEYLNASMDLCEKIALEGYISYYDPKCVIYERKKRFTD